MSLAARIAAGFLLLVGILGLSSWWQLTVVEELVENNRRLAEVDVEVVALGLGIWGRLGELAELSEKYEVLRDDRYREEALRLTDEVGADLETLGSLEPSSGDGDAARAVVDLWNEARAAAGSEPLASTTLDVVRDRLAAVLRSARRAMAAEAADSAAEAGRARTVAWSVSALAFFAALTLVALLSRSIAGPIRRLARGARRIAEGDFSVRVERGGPPEVAALAHDFNEMSVQLAKLDGLKRDLISNVSHDLKAPLASMQETTALLLDGAPGGLTDQQERLLRLNLDSGRRLSDMIANVLDLSRLDAGAAVLRPEPCRVGSILAASVGELAAAAETRAVEVVLHPEADNLAITVDRELMTRALSNVVQNAVKFSPEGGRVEVGAALADPVTVVVEISDSGPGIPDEEKERVFERFHRADATRKGAQGTGLGLAIACAIVEAHEGRIWVEDDPGGGSRFKISLAGGMLAKGEAADA